MFSNVLLSHSLSLDMLNNFCFHTYAQKWLFIGENCNGFFGTSMGFFDKTVSSTLSCEFRIHRAGSHLKILDVSQKLGTRNTLTLPLSHSLTLTLIYLFIYLFQLDTHPRVIWFTLVFSIKNLFFSVLGGICQLSAYIYFEVYIWTRVFPDMEDSLSWRASKIVSILSKLEVWWHYQTPKVRQNFKNV